MFKQEPTFWHAWALTIDATIAVRDADKRHPGLIDNEQHTKLVGRLLEVAKTLHELADLERE